ncbi:transcriptional regulator [Lentzea sp. NEAU-D7]|uniref:transcriptional regulator n=1 Tax=Lentzea sp. NEAU-D7 TaxID=2994667 RepID=UPI00224A5CF9|nr:transcriptional regulator [Lentzea sp. NEAU-D7]MCX2953755.1 transcriptional regulator [Lentzea sp. NEAU-D7]
MFNGDAFSGRVDKTDVRHVETLTSALRALDHEYGGGACRDACVALLNWANPLIDTSSSGQVLHRLQVAIADLHNLAGWASFDMGLLESAHLHFGRAMGLARASGNSALEANIHYRMGRVHLHYELPEDALSSFQRGLPIAQASGSTLAVSILHANEAWAFAKMGAERQALRQFARAEDEFHRSETEDAPPWARFFDLADLVSIGGMVHTELARTCDVKYARSAIPLLTRAISSDGAEASRSQSFRLAALAMNYLVQNDAEQAREIGEQAIALSGPIRSARTRDRMRPLKVEAERLRGNEAADDLASRLGKFMTASRGAA